MPDLSDMDRRKCAVSKEKRRRSSLSRRVSFSATNRVKEFHKEQPGVSAYISNNYDIHRVS
jgi:predicted RNA-binding protein YlxR (DUF448 family)